MQIFTPYTEPLRVAECLDPKRLRSQINECKVILRAIRGESDAWANHPVCKQYKEHGEWLRLYCKVLNNFHKSIYNTDKQIISGTKFFAELYNTRANQCTPDFITDEFMNQHMRRLYTKNPTHYAQWAELGTSDENWYSVGGEIWKYCNGKRI